MRNVYSVWDRVALAYLTLVTFMHDAPAVRSFSEAIGAVDSPLSKSPDDYELHYVGQLQNDFPQGVSTDKPVIYGDVPRVVITGSAVVASRATGPVAMEA